MWIPGHHCAKHFQCHANGSERPEAGIWRAVADKVASRIANQITLSSSAFATACVLLVTSSLLKLDVTWNVTVRSVMPRIFPISSAVLPAALQRSTSHSRSVSWYADSGMNMLDSAVLTRPAVKCESQTSFISVSSSSDAVIARSDLAKDRSPVDM